MSSFEVKLPDVGEGVAEAELVSWTVAVGDEVTSESTLAEVMTDKATIEVACPVHGTVTELRGEPGDVLSVGSVMVVIATGDSAGAATAPRTAAPATSADEPPSKVASTSSTARPTPPPESSAAGASSTAADETTAPTRPAATPTPPRAPAAGASAASLAPPAASAPAAAPRGAAAPSRSTGVPNRAASPAVRDRARSLGIDLADVRGTGPDRRVTHADLDRVLLASGATVADSVEPGIHVQAIRGLRRRIAERLTKAWQEIPHITYVEAVDVTELESVRRHLNHHRDPAAARVTLLPFLVRALVIAAAEHPSINATYDIEVGELTMHEAVHVGIATQTPDGLVVPVVRNAASLNISEIAERIATLAEAARSGTASREDLMGSTITITSLGALGGVVSTPIINQPEVAIVGVNKIEMRPVWRNGAFEPRQMMNLSSSFDHRIVDGWDAATFIQRVRELLETPALLFID